MALDTRLASLIAAVGKDVKTLQQYLYPESYYTGTPSYTSANDWSPALTACLADASATGKPIWLGPHNYHTQSPLLANFRGLVIHGAGKWTSRIIYHGNDYALGSVDPPTYVHRWDLSGFEIQLIGPGVGGTALRLDNVTKSEYSIAIMSNPVGGGGVGINLIGGVEAGPYKQTYWNTFRQCELIANGIVVKYTGIANANVFLGGTISGDGIGLSALDGTTTWGGITENIFWGTSFYTANSVMMQIGTDTPGAIGQIQGFVFDTVRLENFVPTTLNIGANARFTNFTTCSKSEDITVVNNGLYGSIDFNSDYHIYSQKQISSTREINSSTGLRAVGTSNDGVMVGNSIYPQSRPVGSAVAMYLDGALTGSVNIATLAGLCDGRVNISQSTGRIGFYGTTPIIRQAATVDPRVALSNLGLIAPGATAAILHFNVKDYGALGDNSTDDATAINACLNAARAARPFTTQRVKVVVPMGIYVIGALLNVAGVVIEGYGATFKMKAGVTGFNMLQAFNASVSVYGLTIDGNKANTTAPSVPTSNACAIYMHQATGGALGVLEDVTINNCHGPAVRCSATTSATDAFLAVSTPARITNLTSDNCLNGVWINGGRDITVRESHITNTGAEGIWFNISRSITVDHNVVDTTGVTVANSQGIADFYCYGSRITNNYVRNAAFGGICVGGGSTTLAVSRKWVISGNVSENNRNHGITIDPTLSNALYTSQVCNGTITGNTCDSNGQGALNGNGIYVHNAADVTVTGNISRGNYWSGIVLDGLRLSASGNECVGNGLYGLELRKDASSTDHGAHAVGVNLLLNNTSANLFVSTLITDAVFAMTSTDIGPTNTDYSALFAAGLN